MPWAYARATSCVQGERLAFRLQPGSPAATVRVTDAVDGTIMHEGIAAGPEWILDVGSDWRSSLYRAVFEPGTAPDNEAYFALRAAAPGPARILLSVPFATWQAYNRAGVPGMSIYWTESPDRAAMVSFDRPGGGPPPEQWEAGLMRWLRRHAVEADYCSNLDLHLMPGLLDPYLLLLVPGHDEYWTGPMRDAVEHFTRRGGNVAFFGANTAWWQIRLADAGRTMICYRDAVRDPVVSAGHPELATVEWSSAPVNRPENSMTGLSFRLGAGCWAPDMNAMSDAEYTVRFADHWVFDGTGLKDGDPFGRGCLGYETDAADIEEVAGIPRVTGRDGTPASFAVLATADLRHWDDYGQGGAATMGVFTAGAGTVFNAGTVNWGAGLDDPVVSQITRNVIGRLSSRGGQARPGDNRADWIPVGTRQPVRALAAAGSRLFAVLDASGELAWREACPQNLSWLSYDDASEIVAIAVPRDAVAGGPRGIYALRSDAAVLFRPLSPAPAEWRQVGFCPPGPCSMAMANDHLFVLDRSGAVHCAPQGAIPGRADAWTQADPAAGITTLTALNGRLIGIDLAGRLVSRAPGPGRGSGRGPDAALTGGRADGPGGAEPWEPCGDAAGCVILTGHAGALYGAGPGFPLRRWLPVRR
jgi:hypothetical protein